MTFLECTLKDRPVLVEVGKSGAPIATVAVVGIVDADVIVCVMLTVLSKVKVALGVTVTDQLGAPVKMVVRSFERGLFETGCVTSLQLQPAEFVAIQVAPGNGARFTLPHECEQV